MQNDRFFCFSFGPQDFLVTPPMFDEGNLAPTTKKEIIIFWKFYLVGQI
jgi:hypothetical protein